LSPPISSLPAPGYDLKGICDIGVNLPGARLTHPLEGERVPEPILRILDYVAPWVLVIVAAAIPAFMIVAIPFAVQKCTQAPKRVKRPLRLRLRIWQLMAAVLVVGIGVELVILSRRAFDARQKAQEHAMEASTCRWMLGRTNPLPGTLAYYQSLERYHERLYQKYDDIVRHPWRSDSPDAPEPKMPDWPEIMGPEYQKLLKDLDMQWHALFRSACL
jgi:hypothetical protein